MKRYVLWLNYGTYEGWHPSSFDTLDELYRFIKEGDTNGQPFEITEHLPFEPNDSKVKPF